MVDADGIVSIWMPTKVNWSWDDEASTEAIISVEDDLGVAVDQWTTTEMELVVENDIQLDGLRVWEETGHNLPHGLGWRVHMSLWSIHSRFPTAPAGSFSLWSLPKRRLMGPW